MVQWQHNHRRPPGGQAQCLLPTVRIDDRRRAMIGQQPLQSLACANGIARDDGFGLFAVQRFQMRGDGFVDIGFLRAFRRKIARCGDAEINDAGGVGLREWRNQVRGIVVEKLVEFAAT